MRMKLLLLVIAIGIGAAILAIALRSRHHGSSGQVGKPDDPRTSAFSEEQSPSTRSVKEQRLASLKSKLTAIASAPKPPPTEDKSGWQGVPPELDALLSTEPADPEITLRAREEAQEFLQKQMLNGTTVADVTCSKSMCRISFAHASVEIAKNYDRHLLFSPWTGSSNYFTNDVKKDGTVESVIWQGRDGFTLPLDDLRQDSATGKYAKP